MKFLARFLGLIVFLAPLSALAVWGVSYVVSCLLVLSAPGKNLELPFETPGGILTVRAGTYSIDALSGVVTATDVRILDPGMALLARADAAQVFAPHYATLAQSHVRIRLRGVEASVTRDRFGTLSFLRYLEKKPVTEPIPMTIELASARIDFTDEYGLQPHRYLVGAKDVSVHMFGDSWTAAGTVTASGGTARISALYTPSKSLEASGTVKDVDLAPIWEHLLDLPESRTWGDARSVHALRAVGSGTFALQFSQAKGARFRADAEVSASGLRTSKWHRPIDAEFQGWVADRSAAGVLAANDGRADALFSGQAAWGGRFAMFGTIRSSALSLDDIPAAYRQWAPKGFSAAGLVYTGPVRVAGEHVSLGGSAKVASATYRDEVVLNASGPITLDGEDFAAKLDTGTWRGSPVRGAIQWNAKSQGVSGFLEATSVEVGPLARKYANRDVAGVVSVKAVVGRTLQDPDLRFRARGNLSVFVREGRPRRSGLLDAYAHLDGDRLEISRLLATSGTSVFTADGWIDLETERVALDVKGVGIELAEWVDDAAGLGTVALKIGGTLDDPRANGRVELFNTTYQDQSLPIFVANVAADKNVLTLSSVSGVRGASRLDGEIRVALESGELSGSLAGKGLQLADFLGKDFGGVLTVRDAIVSGTLEKPSARLKLEGRDLIAHGIRIDSIDSEGRFVDGLLTIDSARLLAGAGSWIGSGWWNFNDRSGAVSGSGAGLDLELLVPVLAGDTILDGTLQADTRVGWRDGKLVRAQILGNVDDLRVNPTLLGNGTFELHSDGNVWTGSAEVGQSERYIQVPEFRYDVESEQVQAQLVALGIPVRDAFLAVRPKLASASLEPRPDKIAVPQGVLHLLERLEGGLDAVATVSGDAKDPTLDIETLELANAKISGEPSGTVSLDARREPRGKWTIERLRWQGGPGLLTASGTLDEHGDINVTGDLNNFRPSWLSLFQTQFASIDGLADAHFDATGPTRSPAIRATVDAYLFERAPPAGRQGPPTYDLTATIGPILITDGGIVLEGDFNARGIRGGLDGAIPFRYPFTIPSNEELALHLSVPKRSRRPDGTFRQDQLDLKSFADQLRIFKIEGQNQTLQANVAIRGTPEDLKLTGAVDAAADEIGLQGFETELRNVSLHAEIANDRLQVAGSGIGRFASGKDRFGKVAVQSSVQLGELLSGFDLDPERLLASAVRGNVTVDEFRIKEESAETGGQLDLIADAELRIGGTLLKPTIATQLPATIRDLKGTMPSAFPVAGLGGASEFDPKFNITYVVGTKGDPAEVRAATASFDLFGYGSLTGTLSEPIANASFTIDDGSIRLPNARVSIEEGGTARFVYRGRLVGSPDLRLDVDLQGRTGLSSVRLGGIVQRYDIDLRIRGNLLDESSQLITARSDPPDLDQAQILNMLGQRDLFEGLASQFLGQSSNRALATTLAGVAVPVLFDPFTEQLARDLGLEYLQLEFNAFEGATITAAKALGKGFLLQGRRQLSETIDNRINYDYRLTYRPPSKLKQLRNVIFSIGADQDRPWKIAVEYTIRF